MAKASKQTMKGRFFGGGPRAISNSDVVPQPKWMAYPNPFNRVHPINNLKNHKKLLDYIKERLNFGNIDRENRVIRYSQIDKQLSGYVRLSEPDRKRQQDNIRGYGPKPTNVNLTLVKSQLDERLTYLMSIFAPDDGMFEARAPKAKQQFAEAFANKMNIDAIEAKYYENMARGILNMLKYNLGGWEIYWHDRMGNKLDNTPDGKVKVEQTTVWSGSIVKAVDPYNFIWDRSVPPQQLAEHGEFFASVDVKREFTIQRMAENKEIWGVERFIGPDSNSTPAQGGGWSFYKRKPVVRYEINDVGGSSDGANHVDWMNILSMGRSGEVMNGVEIVNYVGWLNPKRFGLSNDDQFEVWRITLMGGLYIVAATKLDNVHGLLPISLSCPNDEGLENQEKSDAELLMPLSNFASFLLNVHQQASRKALYGVTIYDPAVVPIREIPDGEVAGHIPIKPTGATKDIRAHFQQFYDAPGTDKTMDHMDSTIKLMQHLIPTNIQNNVASLERATMYQAAAVAQGTNRRSLKLAKIIDSQALNNLRFQLMYNIMWKLESLPMPDTDNQQDQTIPMATLRTANIEFIISEGLKGIDKLLVIESMKEVLMAIIQNREAMQEIDVVDLLNYWSTLLGDRTDLTQFKKKTIWSSLPPPIQNTVEQLVQSGQLNPMIQKMLQAQAQQQIAANGGQVTPGALPNQEAITKDVGMMHRNDILKNAGGGRTQV